MARHELLTEQEVADLREIDRLLDEAYVHAFAGDGYCKSSEGHISVSLGNFWDRDPEEPRRPVKVEVYSYSLGPHRSHYFDSTTEALEVVRQWHRREMAYDYGTESHVEGYTSEPDLYLALEQKRHEEMEESMRRFEAAMEEGEIEVYTFGPGDDSAPF